MPHVDLLSVGEAFDDLVFFGLPRLPRPGEEIKTDRFVHTVGGGAIITAVAATRLGLRCEILSALSQPAAARLAAEGVRFRNLRRTHEPPAITVALSTRRERSFVTFNGVNATLEERILTRLRRPKARHLHFALNPIDCAAWTPAIERLRARGISTSWDFGWNENLRRDREFSGLIAALDFVLLNAAEARLYANAATLSRAMMFWKRGTRNAVVKLGARGSRWIGQPGDVREPGFQVDAVDSTGAGDAFNAGFLTGLLGNLQPRECLRFGNAVGALSTRAPGGLDGLPAQDEVRRYLGSRKLGARSQTTR